MDHEPFLRAEQLVGDDERADRLIVHPSASVADDVRVPFRQSGELGGVEPSIHAGNDREMPSRRNGEFPLVAEILLIGGICRQNFV